MPTKLTPEIISAAILGFEEQKRHIDANIAELRAILSGDSAESTVQPKQTKHKRRKVSAAGRARIAEAQRKRWAESKAAASQSSNPEVTPKPKRKLSEAGRKAIVAATKKRWALKRAEAAKTQQAAPKKTAAKKAVAKKTATTSTSAAAKTAS
jgi:hypothetical protein